MAAQVAGVVIGHLLGELSTEAQAAFGQELGQELAHVDHLEVHAELGVLVLEGVIAVGRGDQNLFDPVVDEALDVFLGQALEQISSPVLRMLSPQPFLGAWMPNSTPAAFTPWPGQGHLQDAVDVRQIAARK